MLTDWVSVSLPEFVGQGAVLDNRAVLDEIRALGFTGVELWLPWQVDRTSVEKVGEALVEAGLQTVCVSSPSYLHGEPTGQGRRLIEASIEVAATLGARVVNTYFGHGGNGDDEASIETYAELVAPLLDLARAANLTIVLENEFDGFGHDPEHFDVSRRGASLRRLFEVLNHGSFRFNFDAANFLCAGEDVARAATLLADAVGYVHVKDVIPVAADQDPRPRGWSTYRDGADTYQTVELGTGDVPWPAVLRRLRDVGYVGWFTLEPHCQRELLRSQLDRSRAALEAALG